MPTSAETFPADLVAAVLAHMNGDHPHDNLLIARAFGDVDAATAAMTHMDGHGGSWGYTVGDQPRTLTVPWSGEISERPEIRREIVALYERACSRLGVEPREH